MGAPSLVLASASPRRRGLLTAVGVPLARIEPADIDESVQPGEAPVAYAERLAREKAAAIGGAGEVILAADTVVHADGEIFGKPTDDVDAARILQGLSGRWHGVTTGWCVRPVDAGPDAVVMGSVTAQVRFRSLTPPMVAAYVRTGEGRDKAGGYGVQGLGAALVAEVRGSTSTVVGLPLDAVLDALARVGIAPLAQETSA